MSRNKQRKSYTVEELMAELALDEEYQRGIAEKARLHNERMARLAVVEEQLIQELSDYGLELITAGQLVQMPGAYDGALPILVRHLKRRYPDEAGMWIARCLAVPAAVAYWSELVTLLHQLPEADYPRTREGLAAALGEIALRHKRLVLEQAMELLRDRSLGPIRQHLMPALKRSRSQEAQRLLLELAKDPDMQTGLLGPTKYPGLRFVRPPGEEFNVPPNKRRPAT